MDKYEITTELMKTFDELEALKRENADLKRAVGDKIFTTQPDENSDFSILDYYAIQKGREAMYKEYFYQWHGVSVDRDESGNIEVTPYEEWLEYAYKRFPDYASRNLFIKYLEPILKAEYEKQKQKAIDCFIEEEQSKEEEASE